MANIKNEHIVWGYGEVTGEPGKVVVLCGLTEQGLKYLANSPGMALTIDPPSGIFAAVKQIIVYAEKDKATLKETLRKSGLLVSEAN